MTHHHFMDHTALYSMITMLALGGCAIDNDEGMEVADAQQALSETQCNDGNDVDATRQSGFFNQVVDDDPQYYNGDCAIGYVVDVNSYDANTFNWGTRICYEGGVPSPEEGGCGAAFLRAITYVWNTSTRRWDMLQDVRDSGEMVNSYCQTPTLDSGLGPAQQGKKVRIALTARITNTGQVGKAASVHSLYF